MPEYGLGREQYDGLLASLREDGYEARLVDPRDRTEFRHLPGDVAQAAGDVLVFVDAHFGEAAALAALVRLVRRKLRRPGKRRRTAVFYGPRGEVLTRVELNEDHE